MLVIILILLIFIFLFNLLQIVMYFPQIKAFIYALFGIKRDFYVVKGNLKKK